MPTTNAEGVITPAAGDAYALTTDLASMGRSITNIRPVANTSERTAAVSARTAASWPISTADPLLVFRADAGAGLEFEVTVDGTNWRTIGSSVWTTYSPALTGFTGTVDRARWMHTGGRLLTVQYAATVTAAVGTFRVPLPFAAAAGAVDLIAPVGLAVAHNGTNTVTSPVFLASTTQLGMRWTDTAEWATNRPFASWASGNRFGLTATIEI